MTHLIEIKIDNKLLFLDDNLIWKFKGNNGLYNIEEHNYIMYILPLLEYDIEEIKTKIPNDYFKSLPVIQLLKFPLDNKMKYWSELALKWIKDGNYKSDLFNWAKDLDTHWMSQKLKHRFWKVMEIRSWDNGTE